MSFVAEATASTIYFEGFESGSLGAEWTTYSSTSNGRIVVSDSLGAPTHDGTYHLAMDTTVAGPNNLNEAILTVDLTGYDSVSLSFWMKDLNDEETALPAPSFVGHADGDGVSFSADGITWYTLTSFPSLTPLTYSLFSFDLSGAASSAGISLGPGFMIKFQQFDNFPIATDGRTFDDILITGTAVPEPATLLLLGTGLGAVAARRRLKKRA